MFAETIMFQPVILTAVCARTIGERSFVPLTKIRKNIMVVGPFRITEAGHGDSDIFGSKAVIYMSGDAFEYGVIETFDQIANHFGGRRLLDDGGK